MISTDAPSAYSRKNPFSASIMVNRTLTKEGSAKDTRHFELDLGDSELVYEVGDALGVCASNDPALVEALLASLGFSGNEEVAKPDGDTAPLREALTKEYVITEPAKQILQAVAQKDPSASFLNELLEPASKHQLDNFLVGRDILDLLEEFPAAQFSPEEFVKTLRKLQPRLYSIASSQKVVGSSVHLTIAIVRYTTKGSTRLKKGVCSAFLAERAEGPGSVPVFIHTAKHFRVPEDHSLPCIMVGPGTGIAPFRAFLQERKATGATGKNWLFFGEQHAATDFLYQEEIAAFQSEGILHRLDTAFSRDQEHKIYVQHRLLEHAKEIFEWLEGGGYFYVCGDARHMAKDVDTALHQVIELAGGKTPEQAKEYVETLKKEKRYRKDVY